MEDRKDYKQKPDANPDPITGQKGAHPLGTGAGAAGVGAVSTAVGAAIGGPIGAVVGAVVGSVAGGLIGTSVAEQIDPTIEDSYWRDHHRSRSYTKSDYDYDNDYSSAYRTGYEGYSQYSNEGMTYADAEPRLKSDYEKRKGNSRLDWNNAKDATRDAWNRADRSVCDRHENDKYWRQSYKSRPYVEDGQDYDLYAPAYGVGYITYAAYGRDRHMSYEEAEPNIRKTYEQQHGNDGLSWDKAKHAIKDTWNRLTDSDRDRHENDEYWSRNYSSRPYFDSDEEYDRYAPAYRLGYDSFNSYGRKDGMTYAEAEPHIRDEYQRQHHDDGLSWEKGKHAIKDVWNRLSNMVSDNERHQDRSAYSGRR
ncbi:MAG: hypothetical protein WBA57_08440 [Elainellaceae cyanobacterium]